MKATGSGYGPRQPDIRQRFGAARFCAIGPLF
jgi:hypothetical protein